MKARVMVTAKCPKNCDGCCNTGPVFEQHKVIKSDDELSGADEIIITGGEPLLQPEKVMKFIGDIRSRDRFDRPKFYLYSALVPKDFEMSRLFNVLSGFQFTLHAEAAPSDVIALKELSRQLGMFKKYRDRPWENKCFRLNIDKRLYDEYDFGNIDLTPWDVVRKMKWIEDCPLPEGEKLFLYELF